MNIGAVLSPYGVQRGDNYVIHCPFHNDRSPSCYVNISSNARVPVGTYHCFSCGASGSWDKLADALKAPKYVYGEREVRSRQVKFNSAYAVDWPADRDWRGISGATLAALDGKLYCDPSGGFWGEPCLYLPYHDNGVFCAPRKTKMSYVFTSGPWVKSAVYPAAFNGPLYRRDVLVLCEGVRDAATLLQHGVPAAAILGAQWSDEKQAVCLSRSIDVAILLFDSDAAGKSCARKTRRSLSRVMPVHMIELPDDRDPAEMTAGTITNLKQVIDSRYPLRQ